MGCGASKKQIDEDNRHRIQVYVPGPKFQIEKVAPIVVTEYKIKVKASYSPKEDRHREFSRQSSGRRLSHNTSRHTNLPEARSLYGKRRLSISSFKYIEANPLR